MNTIFFDFLKRTAVILPMALFFSCGQNYRSNEDSSNASGNNNPSEENTGNHANEPRAEPGTHYPGSSRNDSAGNQLIDTLHKVR